MLDAIVGSVKGSMKNTGVQQQRLANILCPDTIYSYNASNHRNCDYSGLIRKCFYEDARSWIQEKRYEDPEWPLIVERACD